MLGNRFVWFSRQKKAWMGRRIYGYRIPDHPLHSNHYALQEFIGCCWDDAFLPTMPPMLMCAWLLLLGCPLGAPNSNDAPIIHRGIHNLYDNKS